MHGIKIPPQDFPLKIRIRGAYARGGAYLQDTTVIFAFSASPFIINGLMEDEQCPVGKDRTSSSSLK